MFVDSVQCFVPHTVPELQLGVLCFMSLLTLLVQVLYLGMPTEAAREPYRLQHPSGQGHAPCLRQPPPSVPNQEQKAAESHAEVRREGRVPHAAVKL